jgi:hypothetical protein
MTQSRQKALPPTFWYAALIAVLSSASTALADERSASPASRVVPPGPVALPAPAAPPPIAQPSAAGGGVKVPSTPHVRFDVPSGLQRWLDADDRMIPWLGRALHVIDACYADARQRDPNAAGVITFSVTMHRTARPSADVLSLPRPLQSIVRCATLRLLRVKMPLFTGSEGERYVVQAHFSP